MKESTGIISVCPLCRGARTAFLFKKQQLTYFKCLDCAFVFAQAGLNVNLTNRIEDFEPAYLDYLNDKSHDQKNHAAVVRLLQKHRTLQGARILDVGCGSGKFVKYLREQGFEAYGLEPSKALFNNYLKEGYFFNLQADEYVRQFPAEKYDLVIASDVLEHIDDPSSFLDNLMSLMSPGATLFISTPDTTSLFARITGRAWHYYNRYHLSLFSRSNLVRTLTTNGLNLVATGKVTRYQSIYYIIKYLFNFMFHREIGVPQHLSRVNIPVNLGDNMFVIFAKGL